jgi:hypothetical protein
MLAALLAIRSIRDAVEPCPVFDPSQNTRYECQGDANVTIKYGIFSDLSDETGGAIMLFITHPSKEYIANCQFTRCQADTMGGACFIRTQNPTLSSLCAVECTAGTGIFVYLETSGEYSSTFRFDTASAYNSRSTIKGTIPNIDIQGSWVNLTFSDWNFSGSHQRYPMAFKAASQIKKISLTGVILHQTYAQNAVEADSLRMERVVAIDNVAFLSLFACFVKSVQPDDNRPLTISHGIFRGNEGPLFQYYTLVTLIDCEFDAFDNSLKVNVTVDPSCRINASVTYKYRLPSPLCPIEATLSPDSKNDDSDSKKKKRLAAIIGGTVGGVVLVAVLVAVIYVATKKQRQAVAQPTEGQNDEPQLEA